MQTRFRAAALLLLISTAANAVDLFCNRRQGWSMDGEFCSRCDLVFGGQVAKKQAWNICLNCSAGCPYTKAASQPASGEHLSAPAATISTCGILTAPSWLATSGEEMLVALQVDAAAIDALSMRYPVAATFLAVMASTSQAPNIFDASTVTMGFRHRPREGSAAAFLSRGDEAMQAPYVTELPLFEQVTTEARGEKLPGGDIEWWVLSTLESRTGSRVIEGPVHLRLSDTGSRVSTSIGNVGVLAPVMAASAAD